MGAVNAWEQADDLLAKAQKLVEEMLEANEDGYGLLASAKDHIIVARGDLDADLAAGVAFGRARRKPTPAEFEV